MIEVYLFDWGDTLMVDFPGVPGKMCEWETVEAVEGAKDALDHLSSNAQIYIATGASESTASEIQQAFQRVDLHRYITGYFCKANLGISKGSPAFLKAILTRLDISGSRVAMVGNSLAHDIEPATAAGIQPIWLASSQPDHAPNGIRVITNLRELCI